MNAQEARTNPFSLFHANRSPYQYRHRDAVNQAHTYLLYMYEHTYEVSTSESHLRTGGTTPLIVVVVDHTSFILHVCRLTDPPASSLRSFILGLSQPAHEPAHASRIIS